MKAKQEEGDKACFQGRFVFVAPKGPFRLRLAASSPQKKEEKRHFFSFPPLDEFSLGGEKPPAC